MLLIDGRIQSCQPPLSALLSIPGSESGPLFVVERRVLNVLKHSIIELLSNCGPVFSPIALNELDQHQVLFLSPLGLVSSKLLNEQPSFIAFLSVLGWDDLSNLLPVLLVEIFHVLRVLDHEGEETVLEQMSFVVLPLSECSLRLSWVLLLIQKLIEDLHGLFV